MYNILLEKQLVHGGSSAVLDFDGVWGFRWRKGQYVHVLCYVQSVRYSQPWFTAADVAEYRYQSSYSEESSRCGWMVCQTMRGRLYSGFSRPRFRSQYLSVYISRIGCELQNTNHFPFSCNKSTTPKFAFIVINTMGEKHTILPEKNEMLRCYDGL